MGGLQARGRCLLLSIHFCKSSFKVLISAVSRFFSTFDFISCDVNSFTFAGFSLTPVAEAGLLQCSQFMQLTHARVVV